MERNFKIWLFASVTFGCFHMEASAMNYEDFKSISTRLRNSNQKRNLPLEQDVSQWCKECITKKITEGSIITAGKFREEFGNFSERLLSESKKSNNDSTNFLQASTYIRNLSATPQREYEGSGFTLKGSLVGTSDFMELNKYELENFSELNIYSKHSVLIDQDLKAPGVNVTLLAPYWFIVGQKKINLKGHDGKEHVLQTAKSGVGYKEDGTGKNGEDGLPGLPGESGGHFFGEGKSFFNLNPESLTIDIRGGKGGKGQNGGNGANGRNGEIGNPADVNNRSKSPIFWSPLDDKENDDDEYEQNVKMIFTFGNQKFKEVYESGSLGTQGGNAGVAGIWGVPGKNGSARIENIDLTQKKP